MSGWEPQEVHTYIDRDGEPCKASDAFQVIVEREPEWSDEDAKAAEALMLHEATLCGGCGNPLDETSDKSTSWIVHQDVCMACRAKSIVQRDFERKHEKDKPTPGVAMAHDGRRFYAEAHNDDGR